jgi:hypothetical protein
MQLAPRGLTTIKKKNLNATRKQKNQHAVEKGEKGEGGER